MSRLPAALAGSVWAVGAAAAHGQQLGLGQAPEIPLWRVAAALVLCLALACAAARALRQRMNRSPDGLALPALLEVFSNRLGIPVSQTRRMKLIENLRLSAQVQVCLFTCDGRDFAIAVSAQGELAVLDLPPEKLEAQL